MIVTAIIKVNEANYVPAGVRLRARIDSFIFTAEFDESEHETLNNDPKVVAVSLSRKLQM